METILYNNQKPNDGKFRTDYCCDKPSFSDLLWRDFCMQNNIKSKVEWTTL